MIRTDGFPVASRCGVPCCVETTPQSRTAHEFHVTKPDGLGLWLCRSSLGLPHSGWETIDFPIALTFFHFSSDAILFSSFVSHQEKLRIWSRHCLFDAWVVHKRYPRWWIQPDHLGRDPVVTNQETMEANFSSKWSTCIPLQIFILVPWHRFF